MLSPNEEKYAVVFTLVLVLLMGVFLIQTYSTRNVGYSVGSSVGSSGSSIGFGRQIACPPAYSVKLNCTGEDLSATSAHDECNAACAAVSSANTDQCVAYCEAAGCDPQPSTTGACLCADLHEIGGFGFICTNKGSSSCKCVPPISDPGRN